METLWNAIVVKQKVYPVFIVLLRVAAFCREVRDVGSLVRGQVKVRTSILTHQGVTSYLGLSSTETQMCLKVWLFFLLISKIYLQNEKCHVLTALVHVVLTH